jgi:hypothetical protein
VIINGFVLIAVDFICALDYWIMVNFDCILNFLLVLSERSDATTYNNKYFA